MFVGTESTEPTYARKVPTYLPYIPGSSVLGLLFAAPCPRGVELAQNNLNISVQTITSGGGVS